MSNIITTSGRTASTIAAEIRTYENQLRTVGMYCVFEIGRRLCEAKEMVTAGEWMEYLQSELGYKQSTANNMMKIYREYNVDGQLPNSQTFGNLDYSKALALLALPADEREDFAQENNVGEMSVRQLNAAIKERDEARKAQEETEAENRDLQQKLLDAQQQVAAAQSSEGAWQEQIDKLNVALNKASADADRAKKDLKAFKANPTIPADVKKKLEAEAAAKATAATEKKLKDQLDAAREEARKATQAKEAAERIARDAEQQLANSKKSELLADPDIVKMTLLFDDIKSGFNKANGCLKKVSNRNPAQGEKLKSGFMALLEAMMKELI